MCKHLIDNCALCSSSRKTRRGLRDIEGKGGVPIPGFVAPQVAERVGTQSWETCPPVVMSHDLHTSERVPLDGRVVTLAPVGRPWWLEKGLTHNPLTRIYTDDGVVLDVEVPAEALDSIAHWQDS